MIFYYRPNDKGSYEHLSPQLAYKRKIEADRDRKKHNVQSNLST